MAWDGWFVVNGVEIVNVERTEQYLKQYGWFTPVFNNSSLGPLLGDKKYRSVPGDVPEWVDHRRPESYDFLGLYPISISGIENSTTTVPLTPIAGGGGVPANTVVDPGNVVFTLMLVAESDGGAEYGFQWLKAALRADLCDSDADSGTICYLASEPDVDINSTPPAWVVSIAEIDGGEADDDYDDDYDGGDADDGYVLDYDAGDADLEATSSHVGDGYDSTLADCFNRLYRTMQRATVTVAPAVTSKQTTTDGASVWTVGFTIGVGDPHEYGHEVPVLKDFLKPGVENPWVSVHDGAQIDQDGHDYVDVPCQDSVLLPINDPLFPTMIPPPEPPSVPLSNWSPPSSWIRRSVTIPEEVIPAWDRMVAVLRVKSSASDIRSVRIRWYADPMGTGDVTDVPCAFCGDMVISYIPAGATLTLDGLTESVWMDYPNMPRRRAESLIFNSNGLPFEWPELTCGIPYVLTVDTLRFGELPSLDLTLHAKGF